MQIALLLIFFISGAAGLLYEVVWTRQLTLILGVTAPAVSTVLATFMAGLGLGGALAGRFVRNRNPIKFYAFCELGIALFGIATPFLLDALAPVYVMIKQKLGGGSGLTAARAAFSAFILLPPSLLMGATMPALSKWAVAASGQARSGRAIGFLYAINTLGAVAGTLGAAFFSIEAYGVRGTIALAAACNCTAALAAYSLSSRFSTVTEAAATEGSPVRPSGDRNRIIAFAVTALSGMSALLCEGIWTRYLVYAIGDNSAYAFAEMLAMFLFGIAVGSWAASPLVDRTRNPFAWLAVIQGLIACTSVASTALLDSRGRYAGFGDPYTGDIEATWATFLWAGVWSSAKVVLLPTLLFGATFPFIAKIVTRQSATAATDVGRALAWNTGGAILGALASGFLILPVLGFTKGMIATGSIELVAGALAMTRSGSRLWVSALCGASIIILFGGSCAWALSVRDAAARALIQDSARDKMLFYEDGAVSSVAVVEDTSTGFRTLYVGGDAQASTDPGGMLHLRLLGHLPALFHRNPKSGLVICCGAGVTLGSLASHPLDSIEVCDLSPTIIQLNRDGLFDLGNHRVFNDPRLRVTIDDGRNHLLATGRTYDVITTDPIDPDDAGVTSIYCKEFYQLVDKRLNPGGVACQWLTMQYSIDVYKSLIQAFRSAFPDCYLYDGDFTTVLVGRKPGGKPVSFDRLKSAFEVDPVRKSLADVGIDDPYDLLALEIAGPSALAAFCGDAPANSDEHPIAEVVAPRSAWGNPKGSMVKKLRTTLAMRSPDRGETVADWSKDHAARFREKYEGIQRSMDSRLIRADEDKDGTMTIESILKSLYSSGPRTTELMALFDRCEYSPGENVGEYLMNVDFGIDALDTRNRKSGFDPAEGARFAKYCFETALAMRPDALRPRLGLALAAARLDDHALAIDCAWQFLKGARYARPVIDKFCDRQTELLILQLSDPNRAAAALQSLERFMGVKNEPTVEAWMAWWKNWKKKK
jgi:spermidine synthase